MNVSYNMEKQAIHGETNGCQPITWRNSYNMDDMHETMYSYSMEKQMDVNL